MTTINNDAHQFIPVTEKRPRWGQWVILMTPSNQCLGFVDPDGGWRDASDGSHVHDVIAWFPYSQKTEVSARVLTHPAQPSA